MHSQYRLVRSSLCLRTDRSIPQTSQRSHSFTSEEMLNSSPASSSRTASTPSFRRISLSSYYISNWMVALELSFFLAGDTFDRDVFYTIENCSEEWPRSTGCASNYYWPDKHVSLLTCCFASLVSALDFSRMASALAQKNGRDSSM